MRNQTGIRAVFENRCRAGLRPLANHLPKVHVPPVKGHFLRRCALGIFIRIPQFHRRVDVKHAAVMAPLEDFAAVNVPREVNQHVAGGKIFAQQRAHVFARHALALELHAALEPRRQDAAAILEVHDGDVFGRRLEVLDEDGQGALRDRAVADEQDFVFEFEHGNLFWRATLSEFFCRYKSLLKKAEPNSHTPTISPARRPNRRLTSAF